MLLEVYLVLLLAIWIQRAGADIVTITATDPKIVYDKQFKERVNKSPNCSFKWSRANGSSAMLNFTGISFSIYGPTTPKGGSFEVIIDGKSYGLINTYSRKWVCGVNIYESPSLDIGVHTLQMVYHRNPSINRSWSGIEVIQYHVPDTTTTTSSSATAIGSTVTVFQTIVSQKSTGIIIGTAAGSICGLAIGFNLALWLMWWKLRRRPAPDSPYRREENDWENMHYVTNSSAPRLDLTGSESAHSRHEPTLPEAAIHEQPLQDSTNSDEDEQPELRLPPIRPLRLTRKASSATRTVTNHYRPFSPHASHAKDDMVEYTRVSAIDPIIEPPTSPSLSDEDVQRIAKAIWDQRVSSRAESPLPPSYRDPFSGPEEPRRH
ncbi:hypothetical protein FRC02_006796 [Tulasnella sp. 418]|nr:hypothetical protein FRC02_006796 [Tulasnella sp. 418]